LTACNADSHSRAFNEDEKIQSLLFVTQGNRTKISRKFLDKQTLFSPYLNNKTTLVAGQM
jgi:hypothetical protein